MKWLMGLCGCFLLLTLGSAVQAQDKPLAPPQVDGETLYVPFPVNITLDGDLSDWANVPRQMVTTGTLLSADAANNGSFSFAVAASTDTLYVSMTSVDAKIVTGKHGTDFWNEDSLEFYVNLTDTLNASTYSDGIYQINVNPGDIGNTDVTALTITGTNGAQAQVTGVVFKTADGWGFEVALPLPFAPTHGHEIGFQAQANGSAKGGDRDVKLIWSKADTGDNSYQNPSVFGRAIFYEVGRTDIPTPVAVAAVPTAVPSVAPTEALPPPDKDFISVNQTGYFPDATKIAVYPTEAAADHILYWHLVDQATGEALASGLTQPGFVDTASGDFVNLIDFSTFTTPGTYVLKVDNASSVPFKIGSDIYGQLAKDSLRYFYLNRSGIDLDPQYAGDWARPAGHLSDSKVTCFKGTDASGKAWPGCAYTVDAGGGWYDAGDFGKYVVNGGISAWTLMNIYEFNPQAFSDGTLTIPENNNGFPDVLDEANWEMNFLLEMQVPEGQPQAGMAFHKLHAVNWDGLPAKPPSEVDDRVLMPPSTAATLNLAATAAQCARIWKTLDSAFADRCLTAAERAWKAANDNPIFTYGNIPGNGGGNYDDANVQDEFFWAAAELFVTTGAQEYHDYVVKSPYFMGTFKSGQESAIYWGDVGVLGTMTLALAPDRLSADEQKTVHELLIRIADNYVKVTKGEGYRVAMPPSGYSWGSNSNLLNNAMVMGYAYRLTDDTRYMNAVVETMDYVLGRNGLNFSFVSGYGSYAVQHPHHRFWADQPSLGYPLVPSGALVGGPNAHPADPAAQVPEIESRATSKRYIDDLQSYSTNEVAINWNAPLAWVSAFLDAHYSKP